MIHESPDGGKTYTSRPPYATIDSVVKVTDSDYIKFLEDKIHALQQEISDEEIEGAARTYTFDEYQKVIHYEIYDTYNDFVNGAKWYREQLKQRQ